MEPPAAAKGKRVTIKVIVLGCSNVGKTSLMKRYVTNNFTGIRRATTGADFMTKSITLSNRELRRLED